jgi:5-methyltetrahydropteroyltriglutamate--homocysteine methyltransferase
MVHYRGGRAAIDQSVYPDLDAFWGDLTAAYREEVRLLGGLGCTYLQLDDTSLAYLNDPEQRRYVASIGGDPDAQHVEYIRHINEALAGRQDERHDPHVPRNFRSSVAVRLRPRRRSAVQSSSGWLLHGVGRRAPEVRATTSCPRGQAVVPGP